MSQLVAGWLLWFSAGLYVGYRRPIGARDYALISAGVAALLAISWTGNRIRKCPAVFAAACQSRPQPQPTHLP